MTPGLKKLCTFFEPQLSDICVASTLRSPLLLLNLAHTVHWDRYTFLARTRTGFETLAPRPKPKPSKKYILVAHKNSFHSIIFCNKKVPMMKMGLAVYECTGHQWKAPTFSQTKQSFSYPHTSDRFAGMVRMWTGFFIPLYVALSYLAFIIVDVSPEKEPIIIMEMFRAGSIT